jgi:hypothetical protein
MSSLAARARLTDRLAERVRARPGAPVLTVAGLVALLGVSAYLRTQALDAAFWIDEAISVGVGTHGFTEIPGVLKVDGSPPLYYLLLHLWMQAFGTSETATHALSLLFSLLSVPVALWAGRSLYGPKTGWIAAGLAALNPYLTYYAQETRMYSLQAMLSLVVAAAFVHVFVRRDRRYLPVFAIALALMLYTHNWALFVAAASVAVLGALWRAEGAQERRALVRDALIGYGAVAVLYLPWIPTLVYQARHTGAPWATRPSPTDLLNAISLVLGGTTVAVALLLVAGSGLAALIRDRADRRTIVLVLLTAVAMLIAFFASEISPSFANRYFASFVGPIVLLAAIGLSHAGRLGLVCLLLVGLYWFTPRTAELESKSNVRSVTQSMRAIVTTGDLVVSTQPETLPLIAYYMPDGVRYADSLGPVGDPRVFDWTNAVERLEQTRPAATIDGLLRSMKPGQELVLVQPILRTARWRAPWTSLVRRRAVQWERRLDHDRRVRREAVVPVFGYDRLPRGVRAVVYRVR